MEIIKRISELNHLITTVQNAGKSIGFVPTMGALPDGHMALIHEAKSQCDFVVVSVFVNPTQFTNEEDLKLYPRTPEADVALLLQNGCDVVFFPEVTEIYSSDYHTPVVPLGSLDEVMEATFRSGHFQGVIQVVYRLFELVQPQKAFFGLKDFQQVAVIRHMVNYLQVPVEIIACPTARNSEGLALSSRNKRLSETQLKEALHIFKTMIHVKELAEKHSPEFTQKAANEFFNKGTLRLEYLEIVDPFTLKSLTSEWVSNATICIACYCGNVRLIDNYNLKPEL